LYIFTFSASDFTGPRFLPCSAEARVRVVDDNSCEIALTSDRSGYALGDTINLTATLTDTVCTNGVTATIQKPSGTTSTIDLTGTGNVCMGSYPNTDEVGDYTITATARDSSGETCNDAITRRVNPTPTSTPIVSYKPLTQTIELCGRASSEITGTVQITGVSNLAEVDLTITYDPTFIIPSKITPIFGSGSVSQSGNTIRYTASSTPISGTADLLNIDWRLQGRDGVTTIALISNLKNANGAPIPHVTQNGTLGVTISPPCLRCTVNLQGRTDHSGVVVTGASGEQTQSYPNGLFAIATTEQLHFTSPGYLSAQMNVLPGAVGGSLENTAINSCRANLLAGDMNGDNVVDILDLANLAQHYQSTDPAVDLNADGIVDILDLALVAGNYQQQGPLTVGR
jgi:hypothetical protein